jgi:hypothetical protein
LGFVIDLLLEFFVGLASLLAAGTGEKKPPGLPAVS